MLTAYSCQHCRNDQILCDTFKPSCSSCEQQGQACYYDLPRKFPLAPFSKIKNLWRSRRGSRNASPRDERSLPASAGRGDCSSDREGIQEPPAIMGTALSRLLRSIYRPHSRNKAQNVDKQMSSDTHSVASSTGKHLYKTIKCNMSTSPASRASPVFTTHLPTHPVSTGHTSFPSTLEGNCGCSKRKSHGQPPADSMEPSVPAPTTGGPPKSFQCTYCLRRFAGKREWKQHERYEHSPQLLLGEVEEAFWGCGVCSQVSKSWDERMEHIGDHYEDGLDMAAWDPRATPAPLHRDYATPLQEFKPGWGAADLLAIHGNPVTPISISRGLIVWRFVTNE